MANPRLSFGASGPLLATPMSRPGSVLTDEQILAFHRNGYLLLPAFLEPDVTLALVDRTKELLASFSLDSHPMTKFETGGPDGKNHVSDDYFLNSGDKIRFFLEPGALTDGKLNRPKEQSVNKIGHALHELDPLFRSVTLDNPRLQALARELRFHKDPMVLQSMVICKQPSIGDAVPPHQDSTFLYTDPPSALGFWFALEDCTASNGALSFLPGSHLTTPISKRFVRDPHGGTSFESLGPEGNVGTPDQYVLEPCDAGTLVLIHGAVLHSSEHNHSPKTRFAYTFHMIDSPPNAIYDERNWLQTEMPFARLYN